MSHIYFIAPYTERSEAMFEASDFRLSSKDANTLVAGNFKRDKSVKGWKNGHEIGIFAGVNGQKYVVFSDHTVEKWEDMPNNGRGPSQ